MRVRDRELRWLCVVPTWNSADVIRRCLESVSTQSRPFQDVVVVDNGSQDDTVAIVNEYAIADMIRFPTNTGFSVAVNRGMTGRVFDAVVWLNADAELDGDFLKELDRAARTQPEIDLFAPKILLGSQGDSETIENVGNRLWLDGLNWCVGRGQVDIGQYDSGYVPLFPSGAVCGIRRSVFESVGVLDESFFAYGEDADFGLRAVLAGHQTRLVPGARAHHILSHSLGMAASQKLFLVERNRILLAWKNHPLPLFVLAGPLCVVRYFSWFVPVREKARIAPMLATLGRRGILDVCLRAHVAATRLILSGTIRRSPPCGTFTFLRSVRRHMVGPLSLRGT